MNSTSRVLALRVMSCVILVLALSCGSDETSEPDTTAPAAIEDLRVESMGCDNVDLAWTAPGDDGTQGKASSYDLRYSSQAITEANWALATECQGEPAPKGAGQTESFTVTGLASGATYHFACKARDDEGNQSDLSNDCSATVGSAAIAWVNDGPGEDEDWVPSATSLSANWAEAACVEGYQYALGTTQGGTEVVGWTSAGTQTQVTHSGLTLGDGETYYFAVRALLGGTPGTPAHSDGITVDINVPNSWVGELPEEVSTLVFTVTWSGNDATSGIKHYDIQVSSDGGTSWGDWLTSTALTSSDFTGINGHTYHFRSRAYDNAGNVEAYPTVPDAYTTVNLSTGIAWVNDGLAEDEDWVASATSLSANWADAAYVDEYQYAIGTNQGGTEVVDWTSTATQTQVTRSDLGLTEAHTYYFSVRSVFGGTPGTPTSSDGITVDITAPSSQVAPLSLEQTALAFTVTWSGSDATSGIKHYDIQVSNDGGSSWEEWLVGTALTSAEFTGINGGTYQFRSRAHDHAGNVEAYPAVADAHTTVNLAAGLWVDWVSDGLGEDADWTMSSNTLSANWPAVAGAEAYEYAIGTTPGGTDLMGWLWAGAVTSATISPISLVSGQTYYVSIRVAVGAGRGPVVSSDGITVDTGPPSSAVQALAAVTSTVAFNVSWSGSDAVSGVSHYGIQVKDGDGAWQDWLVETVLTESDFFGEVDHTYYFRSRAYDVAGNVESYPAEADAYTCVTCSFTYSLQWGQEGSGDGDLQFPWNVKVDALGNVYVAESGNHRVQVFDAEGTFLDKFGEQGYGDGEFITCADVAIDDSGYIYVTDFGNHRVQKFTGEGTFLAKWGHYGTADSELYYPRGICVDDSFYVYVAEQGNNRIHKYTSKGVTVATWGDQGGADGQFDGIMCVAVGPSGNIYATDCYNNRVEEFTAQGDFVRKWGSYGVADGQFNGLHGIEVDAAGYIYVADGINYRIQRFTSDGRFLAKWGSRGTGDGEFDEAFGVAVGPDGAVYVADINNCRIQKFLPTCP